MTHSQHVMLKSKNKNQMEIWEFTLNLPLLPEFGLALVFSLLPPGPAPFHHLVFLVMDIVFAKRKKRTHYSERRRLGIGFSSALFSGPEIL